MSIQPVSGETMLDYVEALLAEDGQRTCTIRTKRGAAFTAVRFRQFGSWLWIINPSTPNVVRVCAVDEVSDVAVALSTEGEL